MPARTKVEVKGFEARHYDSLMNLITLGKYAGFIRQAIADLQLPTGAVVADLGAGTGKNAELMLPYLGERGKIYALEIGEEMKAQLRQRQERFPQIELIDQRIEQPFTLPQPADTVFISFVLHGFEQPDRLNIIRNALNNLKNGGEFCILDYNQFDVDAAPWYVRLAIRKVECELAEDFINRNWPAILKEAGFQHTRQTTYFRGYVRLLCARK